MKIFRQKFGGMICGNYDDKSTKKLHARANDLHFSHGRSAMIWLVNNSNFNSFQENESKFGFKEAKKEVFFRKGKKNQWKDELSISQVKKIENILSSEMKILGYL